MTRLFILLYIGVLAVLFVAWYIHSQVTDQRLAADRTRVFEEAHAGGARLVAKSVDEVDQERRPMMLADLGRSFGHPIQLMPLAELTPAVQRRFVADDDVVHYRMENGRDVVAALLADGENVVRLGPFPDYGYLEIEDAFKGWMRLATTRLALAKDDRQRMLSEMAQQFDVAIALVERQEIPGGARLRLERGREVVFFLAPDASGEQRGFAASELEGHSEVFRCGPFPNFERGDDKAATTTLALVLLPAALAIALLLRPIARQLRRVEHAAKAIAAGDLTARVDEQQVGAAAKPLAQAFNHMASRTETMLRTQRELLQAVSHELRTPLARIHFAIDLIRSAPDDRHREERLHSLENASEELDDLVGELLRYVRLESDEDRFDVESLGLIPIVEQLLEKHAQVHPTISFEIGQRPSDQVTVQADRAGFERALGNLIANAARFAERQVVIHILENEDSITIDIDDDGPGIPAGDRQRVFEPFVRLEDSGHGVGLGLALVRRIVSKHGGSVAVQDSPLGGSRLQTGWPRRK
ncbi:MAG: two-component sensor histidine kinase [Blastopirellula sp.]|nr:two-component sensor histidine kinase [Blastopirellula sp.]